ncbi:hypothetical protein BGZ76_005524 [Entomortierella beljakovae]|nr:hypothetical protein BGZ76_005524 [Entomortierella beljakovae]
MGFAVHYPSSKPFSKGYTVLIIFVFLLFLTGITVWNFETEKDCNVTTRDKYDKNECKAHNLNNGDTMRIIYPEAGGSYAYTTSLSGLAKEYEYKNTTFDCTRMSDFSVTVNQDWSTAIFYNTSCNFNDQDSQNSIGTNFTLVANVVVARIILARDSWLSTITCPVGSPKVKPEVLSLIYYMNREEDASYLGDDFDPRSCWLSVDLDYTGKRNKTMMVQDYFDYKYREVSKIGLAEGLAFQAGYPCSDCPNTSNWKRLLGLLTVLCSIGGNIYTVLIYLAQKMYHQSSDNKFHDDTEKFIHLDKMSEDRRSEDFRAVAV